MGVDRRRESSRRYEKWRTLEVELTANGEVVTGIQVVFAIGAATDVLFATVAEGAAVAGRDSGASRGERTKAHFWACRGVGTHAQRVATR